MNIKKEIQKLVREALATEQSNGLSSNQQYRAAIDNLEDCINRLKSTIRKQGPSQQRDLTKESIVDLELVLSTLKNNLEHF
jgi:hypothetical protein